jgi:hypothetical protein
MTADKRKPAAAFALLRASRRKELYATTSRELANARRGTTDVTNVLRNGLCMYTLSLNVARVRGTHGEHVRRSRVRDGSPSGARPWRQPVARRAAQQPGPAERRHAPTPSSAVVEPVVTRHCLIPASERLEDPKAVVTVLDKELKRQITVDGVDFTVVVDPDRLRLIGKGKRKPGVELLRRDLLSGAPAEGAGHGASSRAVPRSSQEARAQKGAAPTSR